MFRWLSQGMPGEGNGLDVGTMAGYVLHTMVSKQYNVKTPGSFFESMIVTACHADPDNLRRIGAGFPMLAMCVDLYKNDDEGIDLLCAMAGVTRLDP